VEGAVRVAHKVGGGKAVKDLKAERREALAELTGAEASDGEDDGHAYDSLLKIHPFFGYVHNQKFPGANNFGFPSHHDFDISPEGYSVAPSEDGDLRPPLVVGIFGGSFAHYVGWHGPFMEELLEKEFPDRRPCVVSMAIAGHALPQTGFIYQYFQGMFDVVIFIDGLNELWNPWENNNAGLPPEYAKAAHFQYKLSLAELSQERLQQSQAIIDLKRKRLDLTRTSLRQSVCQLVLTHRIWRGLDTRWTNDSLELERDLKNSYFDGVRLLDWELEDSFKFSANRWREWHGRIDSMCSKSDTLFLHYLQPNPHVSDSKRHLTDSEKHAMHHTLAIEDYVVRGYPVLRKVMNELATSSNPIRDMTQVFLDVETEIWWDAAHPTQPGQEIVQQFLVDEITESLQ